MKIVIEKDAHLHIKHVLAELLFTPLLCPGDFLNFFLDDLLD